MEQHPIPQNITAYKFRLVGSMTLKQFLELAAGVVAAWLIFNSSTNILIKWTLAPLLAFIGFALAFLPFEDRPLDQWFINFIKAIYSPTQFTYQPQSKKLDIFSPPKSKPEQLTTTKVAQSGQLEEYLKSLPPSPTTAFDQAENKYLEHIHNLFGALGVSVSKKPPSLTKIKPSPPSKTSIKGIRVRKLMTPQMCLLPHATLYQSLPKTKTAAMPVSSPSKPQSTPTKPVIKTPPKPTPSPPSPTTKIKTTPKAAVQPISKPKKTTPQSAPIKPIPSSAKPASVPSGPVSQTVFASNVIFPQIDQKPNLITGVTLSKQGKIIPSVILEIKDSKNYPIRALKSNKLGQFFIATPLNDGIYQISAEHPEFRFAIMKLEAKGEIIPPIKIQSL